MYHLFHRSLLVLLRSWGEGGEGERGREGGAGGRERVNECGREGVNE